MEVKADETSKAIVPVLACVLNQLCMRNDRLPINQKNVSKFHALRPPAISIKDYLSRISKYAACSGECFVLALVYIDRIIQSNPTFVVNSLNIHRLLITSVMLAAKFFDDQYFNNAYYAKVGGVPCNEMNSLEVEFLFMTNFTLFVATDTYRQYYTELCNHAANSSCGCSSMAIPKLVIPPGPNDQSVRQRLRSGSGAGTGKTGEIEGDTSMVTDSPAITGAPGPQVPGASMGAPAAGAGMPAAAAAAAAGGPGAVVVPSQPSLKQLAAQQQAAQQMAAAQQQAAFAAQQQAAAAAAAAGKPPGQYGFAPNPQAKPMGVQQVPGAGAGVVAPGQPQYFNPYAQAKPPMQQQPMGYPNPQMAAAAAAAGGAQPFGGVPQQPYVGMPQAHQPHPQMYAPHGHQHLHAMHAHAHAHAHAAAAHAQQSKPMGIKAPGAVANAGPAQSMITGSPPVPPVS